MDATLLSFECSEPLVETEWLAGLDVKLSTSFVSAAGGRSSLSPVALASPTKLRIGNTLSTVNSVGGMKTTAFGDSVPGIACWHL